MKKNLLKAFFILEIFVTVFRGRIIFSAQSPFTEAYLPPVEISIHAAVRSENDDRSGANITRAGRIFDISASFTGEKYMGKHYIFKGSECRKNTPDSYPPSKTVLD